MATTGGATLLHRKELGEIAIGKQADIALFTLDEPRFSGYGDAIAALIVCGATKADYVMVAGKWKVKNGAMVDVDIKEIMTRHRIAADELVTQF